MQTNLKKFSYLMILFSLLTTSLYGADKVNAITGPASITKGEEITVAVDYKTTNKDLVFSLQKAGSPWTNYSNKRVSSSENGSQITFTVPNNIPSGTALMYQAYLTSKGKGWGDHVAVVRQVGVEIKDSADIVLNTWHNRNTNEKSGILTATFTATPLGVNIDSVIGFSDGTADAYTDLGIIVRFASNGKIDARNGSTYASSTNLVYEANKVYTFRLEINFDTKKYSIYVTPEGQGEVQIGNDYAFRTEQSELTSIDNMAHYSAIKNVVTVGELSFGIDSSIKCDKNDPQVHIIDSVDDWDMINSEDKTIFCVKPGDYSALNRIKITSSGTKDKRRYILLDNGNKKHPAQLKRTQLSKYVLEFERANYWTVDRQAYWEAEEKDNQANMINKLYGSSNNVFTNGYFVDTQSVFYIHTGSTGNIIKNWHIEKTQWSVDRKKFTDTAAIILYCDRENQSVKDTQIINNEIINYVDGIQTVRQRYPKSGNFVYPFNIDFSGTVIKDNLLYVTNIMYSNGHGISDREGKFSFTENAIDLKGGSSNSAKPILIENNIMFGYRESDETKTSLGDPGAAVVSHYEVKNLVFKNNIIFNSRFGYASDGPLPEKIALSQAIFSNNIFYNIYLNAFNFEGEKKYQYDAMKNVDIKNNLFYEIKEAAIKIYNSEDVTIENNDISAKSMYFAGSCESERASKNLVIRNNKLYVMTSDGSPGSPCATSEGNIPMTEQVSEKEWMRSYTLRKFTNNPVEKSIFQ